ncbi:MAG: hypothetical protein FJ279_23760 [Planctomycetes bacterium]|nr:hypothetical protein [Planctomycetota bacterium]
MNTQDTSPPSQNDPTSERGLNQFIARFCDWASKGHIPRRSQAKLSQALRKAVHDILPAYDGWRDIWLRPLSDTAKLSFQFDSDDIWAYPGLNGNLIVGVVTPSWRRRWKTASRDEYICDLIDSFFHFASQYVARSRIASVIGAVALTYGNASDFRSEGIDTIPVCGDIAEAKRHSMSHGRFPIRCDPRASGQGRTRELLMWIRELNGLDPYIHRAIYQFWKATALCKGEFWEEAIGAFDSVNEVADQFVKDLLRLSEDPRDKGDRLQEHLGISKEDGNAVKRLYLLRCDFSAHPARSKWWDFQEIYDDDIDALREVAKRVLWHLSQAEKAHRKVEPYPRAWSDWFLRNSSMLLDAVWFDRLRG